MNLIKTLFEELVSLKRVNAVFCLNRSYSQHPPSLHAFYDSWDKSNVVVFQGANKCQSVILWAVFSIPTIAVEFVYSLKIKRRVTFTCVNEIEAMYGRSLVHVKVESRSTLLRQFLEEVYLR